MIGVYAICQVKAGQESAFAQLVQAFIKESRGHRGCQSYDAGWAADKARTFVFIERWASAADLDAHLATAFFQENAPALLAMTENGLEINRVALLNAD